MAQMLGGLFASGILKDGTAVVVPMGRAPLPATVWTRPAAGDTVAVTYSTDGGKNYNNWTPGAVTAYTEAIFTFGVTHLKFQRTVGAGTTSTYGIC